MAIMRDTEGVEIPKYYGRELFDIDLCCWDKAKLPDLCMSIPAYMDFGQGVYDSCGTVTISLKDVLEEYHELFVEEDGGVGIETLANYLEDYAKRIRKKNEKANTKD
tara:strand:+ start:142 stop:462 length:321 start_codon:yes stop_codon:yes gene_type:complete